MTMAVTLTGASSECVSLKDVQHALQQLGVDISFLYASEVEIVEPVVNPTKKVVVYIPADEDLGYYLVDKIGDEEDSDNKKELNGDVLKALRDSGVCTHYYLQHPRFDRHGCPFSVVHDDFAAGVVGEHMFKASKNMVVTVNDFGDDTPERIWLEIEVK